MGYEDLEQRIRGLEEKSRYWDIASFGVAFVAGWLIIPDIIQLFSAIF